MKMGDPGYSERDETTQYLRYGARKDAAFTLAVEELKKEGIDFPEQLHYLDRNANFSEIRRQIGAIVVKAKGLTIDSASPELKKSLIKETKEDRDVAIGWEYFDKVRKEQEKRVKPEDVAHIDYYSHYGKTIDIPEIVAKVKAREANLREANLAKAKKLNLGKKCPG